MITLRNIFIVSLFSALLCGCAEQDIQTYTVKKAVKAPMAGPGMQGAPNGGAPGGGAPAGAAIKYDTPEGWSDIGGSGMRVAAFEAGAVSITVIPLPGNAGTLLGNVNRWRGQVGLDPVADEAALETSDVAMAGSTAKLVDLVGAEQSMTAAILHHDGSQWFFKMMGPAADVTAQRAAFESFLRSVTFP